MSEQKPPATTIHERSFMTPWGKELDLEFGSVLKHIAALMRAEICAGVPVAATYDMFGLIEQALHRRVHAMLTRAYHDGYDHGRRDFEGRCCHGE